MAVLFVAIMVGPAWSDDDWQFWMDLDYGGVVHEDWSLKFKQSYRWKENAKDFQTYFFDGSVTYQAANWLNLAGAYRQIWNRPADTWERESRPQADLVLKTAWSVFSFSNRNRLEWRSREDRDDTFRYRNRFTALMREGHGRYQLRPFIAGELFLDEGNGDALDGDRYRCTVGLRADPEDRIAHQLPHPPAQDVKAEAFFTYESTRTEDERNAAYIVGLKLGAFF
jgi:hypothetical protein